jgi:hypothetical protein
MTVRINSMTETSSAISAVLAEVPDSHHERIIARMKWAVWLSVVTIPFGYCITALLARIGPAAWDLWVTDRANLF